MHAEKPVAWEMGRRFAWDILQQALAAVDPEAVVREYLTGCGEDWNAYRRIVVAGVGKAAVPMARAVERELGEYVHSGLVIIKYGHGGPLDRTEVREAGHPQPDGAGLAAAWELTRFLSETLTPDDLLIFLISGGGSALFPYPVEPLTLADKQQVTRALIAGGADIREINAIRKHLSRVKGGRLLDFVNGARVLSLVLSDVIGDDLSGIASGPTCPDPTTFGDCLDIIARYGLEDQFPASALAYLRAGAAGGPQAPPETPKPGDPRFERVRHVIVANNFRALEAASRAARQTGFQPLILTSSLEGDTGEAARFHVAVLREVLQHGHPLRPPACIITGGETTVRVKGDGLGGRNMEFVLHCALAMGDWEPRSLLIASVGTDGTDGPTNAAGAWADCATVARGRSLGLDAAEYLRRNDSYRYFQQLDDLVITGPTRTNVMDLRLMLVA